MKKLILIILILASSWSLTSCMQNTNSHSNDDRVFRSTTITEPVFAAAYQVLYNKCINCHSGRHAHWADLQTPELWLSTFDGGAPLVVANDLVNSSVVYRLNFWGSIGGMPENDSNLTQAEYDAIKVWIQSL